MPKEVDLTGSHLFKKIWLVALPFMISGILQLFYNAADLIVCGRFGSEHSVAAISATNSLINLIIQLFLGLSVGASVLMARCYGAKNQEKASRVAHSALVLALILGVIVGLFGMFTSHQFLILMQCPADVIHLSSQYLIVYFAGLPFAMIYNFGSALLRATGDSKRPFYYLSLAGIVNVLLNLFLVIVVKLDVLGVAIATITAQAISAILILRCLLKEKGFCKIQISLLRLHKKEVLEMMWVGLPAGFQSCLFALSNVLIQSSVNSLGTLVMDGNGASSSLEGFVYTSMNAVAQTCITFVSANYGARKIENIQKSILYSSILVILIGSILGGTVVLLGKPLLSFYSKNPEVIAIGYQRLVIICLTYFLCGLMDTFASSLRGLGYSNLPMIVSLLGACGLRILWIFTIFKLPEYHNIASLSVSYPISWLITATVHFLLLMILQKKVFKKIRQS